MIYLENYRNDGVIEMNRKRRLELNKIAPCFIGYKGVEEYYFLGDKIIVISVNGIYSAQNIHGTYGFITKHC